MAFRSAVITFPGSNCDRDMAVALEQVSGTAPHRVWHGDADLPERLDFIALPGGFSYGDYLRSGAMAARSPIMQAVVAAASRGVPVLGVCNGFQVLTEAGLLPGALMRNAGIRFVCREVALTVANAHAQGQGRFSSPPEPKFSIKRFVVDGENPLSEGDTDAILAGFTGEQQGVARLQQAARTLESELKARGYGFYRVTLPPQDVVDTVTLKLIMFRVGTVVPWTNSNGAWSEAGLTTDKPSRVVGGRVLCAPEWSRIAEVLRDTCVCPEVLAVRLAATQPALVHAE